MAIADTSASEPAPEDKLARWRPKTDRTGAEIGRFVNVEETIRRYGREAVQPLLDGALTSDDLALEVIEDFSAMRGRTGRAMFDQALEHGIESVEDPPDSMVRLFRQLDNPPEWVDPAQIRRGQIAYFRTGPLASFVFTCSVIAGSTRAYGITRTVTFAGRFQDYAAIRARETARWLVAACRPGGMERDAKGFKLTAQVRLLHAMTRRGMSSSPNWNWDEWGVPMPDVDQLYAVSFDFTQALVDPLVKIGFRFSDQELEDIYALWRYIGHVMGVPHHMLHRGPAEGRQFADMYLSMDPGPDEECRKLLHALIRTTTPEEGAGIDLFPPLVMKLMPPLRLRKLLYGFTRYWTTQEMADRLEVPDTAWAKVPAALIPFVRAWELARRVLRFDDEKAAAFTVDLFERASAPQEEGEQELAPYETQEDNVRASGEKWGGGRGSMARLRGSSTPR